MAGGCLLIHTEGYSCAHCKCSGPYIHPSSALLLGYAWTRSVCPPFLKDRTPCCGCRVTPPVCGLCLLCTLDSPGRLVVVPTFCGFPPSEFSMLRVYGTSRVPLVSLGLGCHTMPRGPCDTPVTPGCCWCCFSKMLLRVSLACTIPWAAIPKQKSKYLNFWQMQIPKMTLCPVSLDLSLCCPSPHTPPSPPPACVLRDNPSSGFGHSLSNSKA